MPTHPPRWKLPPLAAVRVFEAAARHQNFTRAAEELGMSQAAVSYRIRQLEDRVGSPLFVREPRQVTLTARGERLAGPVSKALNDIAAVFHDLGEEDQSVLTISALPTMAITWLSPRLARFTADNPQLDVRVETAEKLVDFDTNSIDLALRYGDGAWPGLAVEKLFDCHYAPLCSPELREALRLREPSDLLRASLFGGSKSWWKRWFDDVGIATPKLAGQGTMTLQMQAMSIQAAVHGHGVAMAMPELFAYEIAAGKLVFAVEHAVPDDRAYWLVYPRERARERKIRSFRNWALAEAQAACLALPVVNRSRDAAAPAS